MKNIMQKDYDGDQRAPLSYELVIHRPKDPAIQKGEPHLILRRKPLHVMVPEDESVPDDTSAVDEAVSEDTPAPPEPVMNSMQEPEGEARSTGEVAAYIASLMHHVPDDVSRVVDAIIDEENKLPRGLPTLDEAMSAIYSNAEEPLSFEEENGDAQEASDAPAENEDKPSLYTKKVEYEDR